ncbi:SDR family NAD(P)-dependent oxidoreductase [Nocardia suismassiliense]|uniref:SDR family NAD(P)-dependent oxidoreductase n=1 Tax=Nocardia suismassiliense TaxID=2077092 RepID=A0ABW6R5T4_9NOCA
MSAMSNVGGKTVVITGASSGIGAAAARELHRRGANVVPVGRSPEKTAEIADELGTQPWIADFADLSTVHDLADGLLSSHARIDVLANNAGGLWSDHTITVDGHEQTFQVNALAPLLLTQLLTDRLRHSGGRVITTSSAQHKKGRLDLDDLDSTRRYRPMQAYATSKLAAALLTREYARRHPEVGVADFDPGSIASEFNRDMGFTGSLLRGPLGRLILTSPEQGAKTLVYLAETDEPLHGQYYFRSRVAHPSLAALDLDTGRRLWHLSNAFLDVVAV